MACIRMVLLMRAHKQRTIEKKQSNDGKTLIFSFVK